MRERIVDPVPAGAFGEPNVLVGKGVVQGGLRGGVAGIAVVSGPGNPVCCRRAQDVVGIVRLGVDPQPGCVREIIRVFGPVVVIGNDLHPAEPGRVEHRTQLVDDGRLVGDRHVGSRISVGCAVLGFVLHAEGVDRHTGRLVVLHELDQV